MQTTQEIALCSFCGRIVTQFEPRYHCMSCVNYDLCSGCQKEAQPSNGHTKDHKLYQLKVGVSLQNGFPLVGGGTPLQYAPGEPHPFWGRMITEKKTPSDRFERLIDSIHYSISHAHEPRSGNFEPEKVSYIMALLGYHERDNIFHLFITSSMQNPHGLAWSDQQTLLIYQICGWDSQQGTRSHEQQMNSVPVEHRQTFTPVEGGMPLLTRSGLRDMIIMEALADPQRFCGRFNDLLSVANTEQTPLIGEGGYRFPDGPIGLKCWPMRPDREAEATRSKMREIARAVIESNWNAIFAHMG